MINILSLVTGIFVGGVAGYLGSLMLTRRMALVGDALGHVALPGIGLGLLLSFDISLGAIAFLAAGVLIVWLLEEKTKISTETLIGIIFVVSLAIGFLIVPNPDLLEALIGDISKVTIESAIISIILSTLIFVIISKIYGTLILTNISEDLSLIEGKKAKNYNLAYLLLIAAIVSIGVKITGSLLVGALMIIPAATARNISTNLKQYSLGSLILGSLSCLTGIIISSITSTPTGPIIILTAAALFAASLAIKKAL